MAAETIITIPLAPGLVWTAIALAGLVIASALVATLLPTPDPAEDGDWRTPLGIEGVPMPFALLGAVFWALLTAGLTFGLLSTLIAIIAPAATLDGAEGGAAPRRFILITLAGLTATLGAVVALPITLTRLKLTREQTDTAKESLYNQKIAEATADLYARRQVTLKDAPSGTYKRHDVWEDDIVRRSAAIDRLEGLVNEQPENAPRVVRMLCLYVRELSRNYPPPEIPNLAYWKKAIELISSGSVDAKKAASELKPLSLVEGQGDTLNQEPRAIEARADMERAVQVVGRLSKKLSDRERRQCIDLRNSNLSKMNLVELDYRFGKFSHSKFINTIISGCDLQYAKLDNCVFVDCLAGSAKLNHSISYGTVFTASDLPGANFLNCDLRFCYFERLHIDNYVEFENSNMKYSAFRDCDLFDTQIELNTLIEVFADKTVEAPQDIEWTDRRPSHWSTGILNDLEFATEWLEWRERLDDPDAYSRPTDN